jgi:hypothetical protein
MDVLSEVVAVAVAVIEHRHQPPPTFTISVLSGLFTSVYVPADKSNVDRTLLPIAVLGNIKVKYLFALVGSSFAKTLSE